MIVRTYGRRNRSFTRPHSASPFDDPDSSFYQENPQGNDIYSFAFSSQDSSHWSFDSEPYFSNSSQEPPQLAIVVGDSEHRDGDFRKLKKARRNGKKEKMGKWVSAATLMETQECGEMMEHVDEVNFALDGLRKAQPARIRRACLLSLLSICCTAQRRRLLRTHGMAKTVIDAVLGLSFDDSPSNLAAAALFYILTSDVSY